MSGRALLESRVAEHGVHVDGAVARNEMPDAQRQGRLVLVLAHGGEAREGGRVEARGAGRPTVDVEEHGKQHGALLYEGHEDQGAVDGAGARVLGALHRGPRCHQSELAQRARWRRELSTGCGRAPHHATNRGRQHVCSGSGDAFVTLLRLTNSFVGATMGLARVVDVMSERSCVRYSFEFSSVVHLWFCNSFTLWALEYTRVTRVHMTTA